MSEIYPLFFKPIYKDYIWGGDKIYSHFNRKKEILPCAESWEVSTRQEGPSIIINGLYQGKSLEDLIQELGPSLLGQNAKEFPLLIKIIDAAQALSFQVHPDDNSAIKMQAEAKTEMWYILEAGNGAGVYAGVKPDIDKKSFIKAIKDKTLSNLIEFHPVKKGDIIFIPGGTVHAIDKGCLILEVQQNSNTTYRVYDWGRDRPLHVDEAMQVAHFDAKTKVTQAKLIETLGDNKLYGVIDCPYFNMERLDLNSNYALDSKGNTPYIFFPLSGNGRIICDGAMEEFSKGTSFLIPAAAKKIELIPDNSCELMKITLP